MSTLHRITYFIISTRFVLSHLLGSLLYAAQVLRSRRRHVIHCRAMSFPRSLPPSRYCRMRRSVLPFLQREPRKPIHHCLSRNEEKRFQNHFQLKEMRPSAQTPSSTVPKVVQTPQTPIHGPNPHIKSSPADWSRSPARNSLLFLSFPELLQNMLKRYMPYSHHHPPRAHTHHACT
jgi:hypothetical protein